MPDTGNFAYAMLSDIMYNKLLFDFLHRGNFAAISEEFCLPWWATVAEFETAV